MRSRVFLIPIFVVILLADSFGQSKSPDKSQDDKVIVPAGTKITVEFKYSERLPPRTYAAKVAWPVRIGFTTAIPVGAKADLLVWTRHGGLGLDGSPARNSDMAELTAVKVEDRTYFIQTDALELETGSSGELTFTLTAELRIKR